MYFNSPFMFCILEIILSYTISTNGQRWNIYLNSLDFFILFLYNLGMPGFILEF